VVLHGVFPSGEYGPVIDNVGLFRMTLDEANEELLRLDELLFKAETGQIKMSWDEYRSLQESADALMVAYARGLSESTGRSYEAMYELRMSKRAIDKEMATSKLHLKLHPNFIPTPEQHELLKRAYASEIPSEEATLALEQFNRQVYGYLFVNAPRPTEGAKAQRHRLLSGLFRR
jgi:hypothetical protein